MYTQLLGHRPLVSCEIFCKLDTLLLRQHGSTIKYIFCTQLIIFLPMQIMNFCHQVNTVQKISLP